MNSKIYRPLTYLAAPYSHPDRAVMEWRFERITRAAALLMRRERWNVFSPITHSHPLHIIGDMRGDWEFWQHVDEEYLRVSSRFVVLLLDGWEKSVGVTAERKIASKLGLRTKYMHVSFGDIPMNDIYCFVQRAAVIDKL